MIELQRLPNSTPNEAVTLFLRRHWIDLLKIFIFSLGLLVIPLVIGILLQTAGVDLLASDFWGPLSILGLSSYLLVVFMLTITEITDYWLDFWIVTTERIINAEQHGLFNRVISEVHLEQVQDITSETKGILETFLTYGDVYVQTAAERERFRFKNIDNPEDVKITISDLVGTCKTTHHHDPRTIAPGIGAPGSTPPPTQRSH